MIKTFIKHWIYELCIEQLFNAFTRNFKIQPDLQNVKIGDTFEMIVIQFNNEQEIRYIKPKVVFVGDIFFIIEGRICEEKILVKNDIYDSYIIEDYRVEIYTNDKSVKYIYN